MPESAPELQAKVAALRRPAAYEGCAGPIEAVETHMSWVFLTPSLVYKLKKPVRSDGVDFSTPGQRHFFCLEELRLNRRLARWVYLDVVALRQAPDGAMAVRGDGQVVDWLVVMRRLPASLMLDALLLRGEARPEHLRRVATQLADFYRGLPPALLDPAEYCGRLLGLVDEHERKLCDAELGFDPAPVRTLCAQLRAFVQQRGEALAGRVRAGRIVEGHGDLRPEHVWLGAPPAIIDCLEFSPELRTLDSADELGFLALECERAGAPDLGRVLLEEAAKATGDVPPPGLVDFHQALRGAVRAALALWHLKEPRYRGGTVWRERAAQYLGLASTHARRCLVAAARA